LVNIINYPAASGRGIANELSENLLILIATIFIHVASYGELHPQRFKNEGPDEYRFVASVGVTPVIDNYKLRLFDLMEGDDESGNKLSTSFRLKLSARSIR
jgi:hypothetical protein